MQQHKEIQMTALALHCYIFSNSISFELEHMLKYALFIINEQNKILCVGNRGI